MIELSNVTVDFVGRGEAPSEYRMVLVEEGPWFRPYIGRLKRLQERLYGCIDAAIDGGLAAQFPESEGAMVVIHVDCYDARKFEIEDFFRRFSAGALTTDAYIGSIKDSSFVSDVGFSISFDVTR